MSWARQRRYPPRCASLVVEDELLTALELAALLNERAASWSDLGPAAGIDQALALLGDQQPD